MFELSNEAEFENDHILLQPIKETILRESKYQTSPFSQNMSIESSFLNGSKAQVVKWQNLFLQYFILTVLSIRNTVLL